MKYRFMEGGKRDVLHQNTRERGESKRLEREEHKPTNQKQRVRTNHDRFLRKRTQKLFGQISKTAEREQEEEDMEKKSWDRKIFSYHACLHGPIVGNYGE